MQLESRVLGPVVLDGGVGGGSMSTVIEFAGTRLPVRLEIDHPGALSQSLVDDVDVMLEHSEIPDRIARDAIADGLRRDDSAPAQLFRAWEQRRGGGDAAEFLRSLAPTGMIVTPDGGRANLDRVVLTYELSDRTVSGRITVRLPDAATGPEIDLPPRLGFA